MSYNSLQLQEISESFVYQVASLPPDDHIKQKQQEEVEEVDDADIIREAFLLDDLAKLITVEEVCTSSSFWALLCLVACFMLDATTSWWQSLFLIIYSNTCVLLPHHDHDTQTLDLFSACINAKSESPLMI